MDIKNICNNIRKDIVWLSKISGDGLHFGGSLSLVEILVALYIEIMKVDKKDYFMKEERDRVIYSKGHGISAYYALLKELNICTMKELETFGAYGSKFNMHPKINREIGLEFSTGSLAQGIALGIGVALSMKDKNIKNNIYVIVGDGELDEGSNWEAFMTINKYNLDNLTLIVDKNNIQYDGFVKDIMPLDSLKNKISSFGLETIEVNGHDINELKNALSLKINKPKAIIANTIKGKGISFMENNPDYHYNTLSEEEYKKVLKELNEKC